MPSDWNCLTYMPTRSTDLLSPAAGGSPAFVSGGKKPLSSYLSEATLPPALRPSRRLGAMHFSPYTGSLDISTIPVALNGMPPSSFSHQPNLLLRAPADTTYCLSHISLWMSHRHLKLSIPKLNPIFSYPYGYKIALINPFAQVRNLKVMDSSLSCVPCINQQALQFHFQKSPLPSPRHHPISSHHLFQ